MRQKAKGWLRDLSVFICLIATNCLAAENIDQFKIKNAVDNTINSLMPKYDISGMAVAVSISGKNYYFNYGVTSKETLQPVTNATLFEIGSLSKTFTATLASYAQVKGLLSLSDNVSQHLPFLRGSSFDNISLMNLGTHTAGDLPMQVPEDIANTDQLMDYYKNWKSTIAVGTQRNYSNLSVGLLSMVTAKTMNMSFENAVEKKLFPELGMKHTYINIPVTQMKNYAQGYDTTGTPTRLHAAVLAAEAYGIKSNTTDLIRFININMGVLRLDEKLQRAITETHTGYFKTGEITQDLIWEQYPNTSTLEALLGGNSSKMNFQSTIATKLNPSIKPQMNVLINKTGSTNGFGAYVLYEPAKKIGIVILANKNYPNEQRVNAAYQIFTQLNIQ